jgi:HSP20 family protein
VFDSSRHDCCSSGDRYVKERRRAMARRRDLAPFEGGALWQRLLGDFDRFFEETNRPLFKRRSWPDEFAWVPAVEVAQREGKFCVRVDLPGVKKEEVTVSAADGYLTIQGERKHDAETHEGEWFQTERTYGRFVRVIPLPEGVTASEITANFVDGVLDVAVPLPKAAVAAEPQKIPIGGAPETKTTTRAA